MLKKFRIDQRCEDVASGMRGPLRLVPLFKARLYKDPDTQPIFVIWALRPVDHLYLYEIHWA